MNKLAAIIVLAVASVAHAQGVNWQAEYAAWQAPGYLLVHIEGDNCSWCDREAAMFSDPAVIAASRHVNCTRLSYPRDAARIAAYRVSFWPTDIIIAPNRQDIVARYDGCPTSPAALVARMNYGPEPANLPAEGPQHSVITEEWICDQNGCRRVPSPGPAGRLNFRPSPLLRRVR
jgi:hypothetical protein